MIKHLKIETIYGLIDLVGATKEIDALTPQKQVVSLEEAISPKTPLGKARQTVKVGIVNIVGGFSKPQMVELVALMLLGRDGGTWEDNLHHGESEVGSSQSRPDMYVTGKLDLDEYLDDGLERLGLQRRNEKQPA